MRMNWRRRVLTAVLIVIVSGGAVSAQDRTIEPVTDALLQDPDPADWLNWRRTLDGWGYSPLDQITRDNVGEMRLAWSWALHPGVSQTTPLVYDGVMYIAPTLAASCRRSTRSRETSSGSIVATSPARWRVRDRCGASRSTTT